MYKKYVNPRYNWENKVFRVLNDKLLQDANGEIVNFSSIMCTVEEDKLNIKAGSIKPISSYTDGFVDATKDEFVAKVYDRIASKKASIASDQFDI